MNLHKQIKQNANRCLYNNWGKAVAIVLLSTAVFLLFALIETFASVLLGVSASVSAAGSDYANLKGLISGIPDTSLISAVLTLVLAIGSFIIVTPLNLGILGWYNQLSNGESDDVLAVFSCFAQRKLFVRSLGLNLIVVIQVTIMAILYLGLPVLGLLISYDVWKSGYFSGAEFVGSMGMVLALVLLVVVAVCWMIGIQKFFLCKFYILDGETTVFQALRRSRQATVGLRDEIFLFQFSFLGWGILSLLMLPVLYVSPYYNMSCLIYARFLIERDDRSNRLATCEEPPEAQKPETEPQDLSPTQQFETQEPLD